MTRRDSKPNLSPSGSSIPKSLSKTTRSSDPNLIEGQLDSIEGRTIHGWARNISTADPVTVAIEIDGIEISQTSANIFRSDLFKNAKGTGRHAFSFTIPTLFADSKRHNFRVYEVKTKKDLHDSPSIFTLSPSHSSPSTIYDLAATNLITHEIFRSPNPKQRLIAIVALHHSLPKLHLYQQYLLYSLKKLGIYTIVVNSNDNNSDLFITSVAGLCDSVIIRHDHGRDFASYGLAINLNMPLLLNAEATILLNDSCFAPLFDLQDIINKYQYGNFDLWGITDSFERRYHIQSYFLILSHRLVISQRFGDFWQKYSYPTDKDDVIEQGEISLSRFFIEDGFKSGVLCPYEQVSASWLSSVDSRCAMLLNQKSAHLSDLLKKMSGLARHQADVILEMLLKAERDALHFYNNVAENIKQGIPVNPGHFFWDTLIQNFKCPFLKRELVVDNPSSVPNVSEITTVLAGTSLYPIGNIYSYFRQSSGGRAPPANMAYGVAPSCLALPPLTSDEGVVGFLPAVRPDTALSSSRAVGTRNGSSR